MKVDSRQEIELVRCVENDGNQKLRYEALYRATPSFPSPSRLQMCGVRSAVPLLRRKRTKSSIHLHSQTATRAQAVPIEHQPRQQQKRFRPVFMARVCFIIPDQLRYLLPQRKFQSDHSSADCAAVHRGISVPGRKVRRPLPAFPGQQVPMVAWSAPG